jgi:hypothetical protein
MKSTKEVVFCHKVTMEPASQSVPTPSDDTVAEEGSTLEPLKQEQTSDTRNEPATEGKKLTQYMASVFGKDRSVCAYTKFPTHFVFIFYCMSSLFRVAANKLFCMTDIFKSSKPCPDSKQNKKIAILLR